MMHISSAEIFIRDYHQEHPSHLRSGHKQILTPYRKAPGECLIHSMRGGHMGDTSPGDICPLMLTSAHIGYYVHHGIQHQSMSDNLTNMGLTNDIKTMFTAHFSMILQTVTIFSLRRQSLSQVTESSKIIEGARCIIITLHFAPHPRYFALLR